MGENAIRICTLTSVSEPELDSIHVLIRQLSLRAPLPTLQEFNDLISQQDVRQLAAMDGSQIVGLLTVVFYAIPTGLRSRMEDLVVLERYRRRGIARALSKEAVRLYTSSGARTLDLTSSPSRHAGNTLHHSMGFEVRDTNVYRYKD